MMKSKFLISVGLAATLLSGCVTDYAANPKQSTGTILGAGLGGWAGSKVGGGKGQMAAVALGALAGAFLGGNVGQSLDRADRAYMGQAQEKAHQAPVGERISWNNPDSGHRGSVTPKRDGYDRVSKSYCREYETTIYIDGQRETGYGTACRRADGTWEIRNDKSQTHAAL
jgi:surface antigen